ncbi:MAG TPA: apolipoprotein N-acyltransferase [Cellvibrio sp.]|nr:apolipoprotein N-acyltransferase [Cellvibrio sp.]
MSDKILKLPQPIALLIAALSGALITLSFAPFHLWPIAIASMVAFALLLKEQSLKSVLWRSFAFAVGFYGAGIHWIYVSIHNFGGASPFFAAFLVFIFACAMAAIFILPFYVFGRWFSRHSLGLIIALPACWLLGEWMRTWFLTGFPWLFLGYAHIDSPLAGWAPVTGVIGIGFILVLTAAVLSEWLWQLKQTPPNKIVLVIASVTCGILWIAGAGLNQITWAEADPAPIKIGMVQPNIDQSTKLSFNQETTLAALNQLRELSADLWTNDWVIWPEAAIPTSLTYHEALPFLEEMNTKASMHNTALFTGVIYDDRDEQRYYNSIAGLGEGYGFYHKRRLVPFGEYLPIDQLRGLIEFFDLPTSFIHLGPQDQHGLIAKGVRITPAICYEIVYPDLIALAAKETQVLLSVNNLGWFLDSIQPKQFMQMAQMRALETGRYLVYSTNNGPSAFIDNRGKILSHSDSFKAQTFTGVVYAVKDWTPFMVYGSGPLVILAALLLLGIVVPQLLKREAIPQEGE